MKLFKQIILDGLDDITVFRLRNIILWMKENPECGFNKQDARAILFGVTDIKFIESHKIWLKENW